MKSIWLKIGWLWTLLCDSIRRRLTRRKKRQLAEGVRKRREKKYLLTVARPSAGCLCAEIDRADRPCLDCEARVAQGFPRLDLSFVTLGEAEFGGLRKTATHPELAHLDVLGLLPTIRQDIVFHPGGCRRDGCEADGVHTHPIRVFDFVPDEEDPAILHLTDTVWYEGVICRYVVLDGGSPAEDALRFAAGEPAPVGPDTCPSCYGELPHHEEVDCPGNDEVDEKKI